MQKPHCLRSSSPVNRPWDEAFHAGSAWGLTLGVALVRQWGKWIWQGEVLNCSLGERIWRSLSELSGIETRGLGLCTFHWSIIRCELLLGRKQNLGWGGFMKLRAVAGPLAGSTQSCWWKECLGLEGIIGWQTTASILLASADLGGRNHHYCHRYHRCWLTDLKSQ